MSVAFTDAAPAFILGVSATPVRRQPDRSFTDLVREAYLGALADAQLADPEPIEATWFANTLMDFWGQRGMRGQAVLGPLITEGCFPNGQWIVNVESIRRLSGASYRKMLQNLWWAAGYNVAAIPLAALAWAGIVLPMAVGAVLMSLSTVVVALNAQLLRRTNMTPQTTPTT